MTKRPEATASAPQAPKPDPADDIDGAFAKQLDSLETAATNAALSLKTETDNAQSILSDIEQRVALGQMGAETVKPLRDAVHDARDIIKQLDDKIAMLQAMREALEASSTG